MSSRWFHLWTEIVKGLLQIRVSDLRTLSEFGAGSGSGTAAQSLPSTRAGDQDDGS